MNNLSSRLMLVSVIVALFLVPLYAHHGNQFLSKAMEMNAAEVRLAEMAANKAQNQRVKDFAQMIMRDHNQAIDKMKDLRDERTGTGITSGAPDRNIKSATDVRLTPEHQRTFNRISALSGADFDREFMAEMIRGHHEAIRTFEAQAHVHGNALTTRKQTETPASQQTARQKPTGEKAKHSRSELRRDVDTAEFARDTLPTLRNHLDQAEQIQKELQQK